MALANSTGCTDDLAEPQTCRELVLQGLPCAMHSHPYGDQVREGVGNLSDEVVELVVGL
jgi:hypothetical protein